MMHVEVCSEELLKNIVEHGFEKPVDKRFIDYRLSLVDGEVRVIITDDGKAFNPVEYDSDTGLGLLLVRGLCDEIKYDYLFSQNRVTVTFQRQGRQKKSLY